MRSKVTRVTAGITAVTLATALLGGAAAAALTDPAAGPVFARTTEPPLGKSLTQTTETATVTVTGTVGTTTAADGDLEYTIAAADGTVTRLDAGPRWSHDPLAALVGATATVSGEIGKSGELDVITITSGGAVTIVRPAEGPPAWAGGPSKVGAKHPGYPGWQRGQAARASR